MVASHGGVVASHGGVVASHGGVVASHAASVHMCSLQAWKGAVHTSVHAHIPQHTPSISVLSNTMHQKEVSQLQAGTPSNDAMWAQST